MSLTPELFLIYGFAFLLLGAVSLIQPRDPRNLPVSKHFWVFGLFGVLHGLKEIYDAWLLAQGTYNRGLDVLGSAFLLVSFLPLFEFGRRSVREILIAEGRASQFLFGPMAYVLSGVAISVFLLSFQQGVSTLSAASRYFVGFPGAIAAAWVLARRTKFTNWATRSLSGSLVAYAVLGGLVVEPVPGLWDMMPDKDMFIEVFGVPVQLFRTICAVVAFVSLSIAARRAATLTLREVYAQADQLKRANLTLESDLLDRNKALLESERRLLEAERIAKIGGWHSNLEGQLFWSHELLEMMGVDPEAFSGKREFFYDMVHPEDLVQVRQDILHALDNDDGYSFTHRMVRPDGAVMTVSQRAEVQYDDEGVVVGLVGILQDMTDTIELEERLRHAQKMETVGNLTGGVAHDFNNLLAVILGNLELVKDDPTDPANSAMIDSSIEAAMRGADLTKNMLSFARKASLEPVTLSLNQQVLETKKLSERVMPENIEMETSLLASLWKTEADANSTQSALLNLLLNARDAMPQGGKLTVETANVRIDEEYVDTRYEDIDPGRYVMLAVSDTGHGIAKADLEKIFDPFFTTKGPGHGSGLGLSMIQGFMKQSGGTVRVYSEPGVGTTFKLYFRALTVDQDTIQSEKNKPVQSVSSGARLLLVEDEPGVLDVLTTVLSKAGYEIETATTGDDAYIKFAADPTFDLLLTDIVMPGSRKGTDLAKDLRKAWPHLPVIFMSGYASEATVHGNGLRPEDIRLMKPVRRSELIDAVETAMARVSAPA
ncbi:MAG: PAS domain-containing protein [Pelagimonas sp.]